MESMLTISQVERPLDGGSGCKPPALCDPPNASGDCSDPPDTVENVVDLSTVTCGCGYGYYKPDGTWVSGAAVRAGRAPLKSEVWPMASKSRVSEPTASEIPSQVRQYGVCWNACQ
jgi:hypothetical protein